MKIFTKTIAFGFALFVAFVFGGILQKKDPALTTIDPIELGKIKKASADVPVGVGGDGYFNEEGGYGGDGGGDGGGGSGGDCGDGGGGCS